MNATAETETTATGRKSSLRAFRARLAAANPLSSRPLAAPAPRPIRLTRFFNEDSFFPLWNPAVVDRLQAPLTRFRE